MDPLALPSANVESLGERMMPTAPADAAPQFRTVREAIARSAAGLKPGWKTVEVADPLNSKEMTAAWEVVQLYKGC
jgi:hypothetical protein